MSNRCLKTLLILLGFSLASLALPSEAQAQVPLQYWTFDHPVITDLREPATIGHMPNFDVGMMHFDGQYGSGWWNASQGPGWTYEGIWVAQGSSINLYGGYTPSSAIYVNWPIPSRTPPYTSTQPSFTFSVTTLDHYSVTLNYAAKCTRGIPNLAFRWEISNDGVNWAQPNLQGNPTPPDDGAWHQRQLSGGALDGHDKLYLRLTFVGDIPGTPDHYCAIDNVMITGKSSGVPSPRLTKTRISPPASEMLRPGDNVRYLITLDNPQVDPRHFPWTLTNLSFVDTFDDNLILVSEILRLRRDDGSGQDFPIGDYTLDNGDDDGDGGGYDPNSNTVTLYPQNPTLSMPSGDRWSFYLDFRATDRPVSNDATNTIKVDYDQGTLDPEVNQSDLCAPIAEFTKGISGGPYYDGDLVSYAFSVRNNTPFDNQQRTLNAFVFEDEIPAGLTFVGDTVTIEGPHGGGTPISADVPVTIVGDTLRFEIPGNISMMFGDEVFFGLDFMLDLNGAPVSTVTNTATLDYFKGGCNEASATFRYGGQREEECDPQRCPRPDYEHDCYDPVCVDGECGERYRGDGKSCKFVLDPHVVHHGICIDGECCSEELGNCDSECKDASDCDEIATCAAECKDGKCIEGEPDHDFCIKKYMDDRCLTVEPLCRPPSEYADEDGCVIERRTCEDIACFWEGYCEPSTGECKYAGEIPVGYECIAGEEGYCDDKGDCVDCTDDKHCGEPTDACYKGTACREGECVDIDHIDVPDDLVCMKAIACKDGKWEYEPTPGEVCDDGICNEKGECVDCLNDGDCGDPKDACFLETECRDGHCVDIKPLAPDEIICMEPTRCEDGTWGYDPSEAGTECKDNGQCDGKGECVHCPADTACMSYTLENGVCTATPKTEAPCGDNMFCSDRGECEWACLTNRHCDNGDVCDGKETCNTSTHECEDGTPLNCDDGNACTANLCDAVKGCQNPPVPAGTECKGTGQCDGAGNCVECPADTACMSYSLVNGVCISTPNTNAPCGDNMFCSDKGECEWKCLGASDCNDGVYCNGVERCSNHQCLPGTAPDCSVDEVCYAGFCNATTDKCDKAPLDAGTECKDNGQCDGKGECVHCPADTACMSYTLENGVCTATPKTESPCGDNMFCSDKGECEWECLESRDCNDGLFCNGTETCENHVCQAGDAPSCAIDDVCYVGYCNERDDACDKTPEPAGTECKGSGQCDGNGECVECPKDTACMSYTLENGICTATPKTESPCGDNMFCSDKGDCEWKCLTDTHCDNGDVCDGAETCNTRTHECEGGTPLNCDDGNECTANQCHAVNGCENPVREGAVCNDGTGFCDANGDCEDCPEDAQCVVYHVEGGTCTAEYKDTDEACVIGGLNGHCDGAGACEPDLASIHVSKEELNIEDGGFAIYGDSLIYRVTITHEIDSGNAATQLVFTDLLQEGLMLPDDAVATITGPGTQVTTVPLVLGDNVFDVNGRLLIEIALGTLPYPSGPGDDPAYIIEFEVLIPGGQTGYHTYADGDEDPEIEGPIVNVATVTHHDNPTGGDEGTVVTELFDCRTDSDCYDGIYCNGAESCDTATHLCVAGEAPACESGDECLRSNACDPSTDACDYSPLVGNPCANETGVCDQDGECVVCEASTDCVQWENNLGVCEQTILVGEDCQVGQAPGTCDAAGECQLWECVSDGDCDDDDLCTGYEACDAITHTCVPGTPVECEERSCQISRGCDAQEGCQYDNEDYGVVCDGGFCDGQGQCQPWECAEDTDCAPADRCHERTLCDMDSHTCVEGAEIACDDGNECTDNACDPVLGCVHLARTGEVCNGGLGICDEFGACIEGECPADSQCVSYEVVDGRCVSTPKVGESCDDRNDNTANDTCDAQGRCVGEPIDCGAPTQCEVSRTPNGVDCDIVYKDAGETCNDGDNATANDICDGAGGCAGTPIVCEVGQCVLSATPNGVDCDIVYMDAGEACDDADNSTANDVCDGFGGCAGTPIVCAVNQCIVSATPNGVDCDIVYEDQGVACDDRDASTRNDVCDGAGQCAGEPFSCVPSQCEESSEAVDDECVTTPKPEGAPCELDDLCLVEVACDGEGMCVGEPMDCGPAAVCDPETGQCVDMHCQPCEQPEDCGEGATCVELEGAFVCLLGCDPESNDCGDDQRCVAFDDNAYCFDEVGQCAEPTEEPPVVEPGVTEPDVTEPVAEPDVTEEEDFDDLRALGSGGCQGGEAGLLALLLLALRGVALRRRRHG